MFKTEMHLRHQIVSSEKCWLLHMSYMSQRAPESWGLADGGSDGVVGPASQYLIDEFGLLFRR